MIAQVEERDSATRAPGYAPSAHVIHSLKRWVDEGVLVSGQPLPSERVLSTELGVARKTVRRALAILEEDGLFQTRNGRLRVVSPTVPVRSRFMADAVTLLTNVGGTKWVEHRQAGWSEYITHGATHAIREAGLHAVSLQPERLLNVDVRDLIGERPMGLILTDLTKERDEELRRWARGFRLAGIPVVIYGGGDDFAEYDRVLSDHEEGSYQLTRWLLEQGRRRILPFWRSPGTNYWYALRRAGYERAMAEAGVRPLDSLILDDVSDEGVSDRDEFFRIVHHYADRIRAELKDLSIDAFLMDTDGSTGYAAAVCREFGLEPNVDVAIAGYDNYWEEAAQRAWEPTAPLVTVDKRNLEIGSELVQLLLDRARGRLEADPAVRTVRPELVFVKD